MFSKLLLIILTAALIAASLLAMRQQRLDLAHDASQIHRRLSEHDRSLWMLQERIAEHCRSDNLRQLMEQVHEEWVPIEPPRPNFMQVVGADADETHTVEPDDAAPYADS